MVETPRRNIVNKSSEIPLISIIIPHYNGKDILSECIDSLQNSTWKNFEIIVVDNHSSDDSIKMIKSKYPKVKIVQSDQNLGYAGGCNLGIPSTKGEYIVFLNNDTIHKPNWLEPMVEILEKDSKISSVQPKIKNYYDKEKFDYAGGCGGEIDIFGFPFARGRIFNTTETDSGQYDSSNEIFWASGTAFMTRKSIFQKTNGFDDTFFAHMEEIDYHWKCKIMGYKVVASPSSIVYHMGGKTLAYQSTFKTYLNHRNCFLMFLTNYNFPIVLILFFPRLILEIFSGIYELCKGRINHSAVIIKSLFWLFFHPNIIVKRIKLIKELRKISDTELIESMYRGSIAWSYFIKKRKTFNTLYK